MKIEISHIPSQGLDLAFEEQAHRFDALKEIDANGDSQFVAPIAIALHVRPMPDIIRVRGKISTIVRLQCCRCLAQFQHHLENDFAVNYSKEIPRDVHSEDTAAIELTAQQIGMIFYSGDEIDFTEAIQEQVVLAMPFKPICREDCRGLCPQCGQDLNKSTCKCGGVHVDGPFAMLKDLNLPLK